MGEPILSVGGRAVGDDSEIFVGVDVAKARRAVAIANTAGRAKCDSLARSMQIRRLFVVWSPALKSVIHGCTSAMRLGQPAMGVSAIECDGASLLGRRAVDDPAQTGQQSQDEPVRCGAAGTVTAGQ